MKTILIVLAGIADLPDAMTMRDTPLSTAAIPSLHLLAQRGELSVARNLDDNDSFTYPNALLSLLGYDLQRGEPLIEELREFGLANNVPITEFGSLRPFIIPGFSGHGVCLTTSAWARGAAKCAMIPPLDIYSPGSSDAEILETIAEMAQKAIVDNEFVLIYVDSALKASLKGDYDAKVAALESIDRHLINPIADFVWKSDLLIHLAVATDIATSWNRRRPVNISVPVLTYFNNHDREGNPEETFTEVNAMLHEHLFEQPKDLIRYLIYFSYSEEDLELPF